MNDYKIIFSDFLNKKIPDNLKENVSKAFLFAEKSHDGQFRKSGEAYITHPLAVGMNLWNFYKDYDLLVAGFLHDVVEDCATVSIDDIYNHFGKEVGFIVDALNKNEESFYQYPEKVFQKKLSRFIWAGLKNFKVFLVKLADRSHNISTLDAMPKNKQINISFETQAVYEPLKKLTLFEKEPNLSIAQSNLLDFFENKSLNTLDERKNFLIEQSFQNLSDELFGLIKKDIKSVIWSLSDYDTFTKITENKTLSKNIKLKSIFECGGSFSVKFYFIKSFELKDIKIEPSTFTL